RRHSGLGGKRFSFSRIRGRPIGAGRRRQAIIAQIFDHLAVMIHGVYTRERGKGGACPQKWYGGFVHWSERVFSIDGGDGFVTESEGLFQILKVLIFGLDGIGAIGTHAFIGSSRRRFAEDGVKEPVVCRGDVLDLLREGAHALEIAIRRSEGILVFRHGLGGTGEFELDDRQLGIESRCNGGRLVRYRRSLLRLSAPADGQSSKQ